MTVEKLKTAVANINAFLSESHDDDTVTLTVNVIRSVMENYEELIKYKESVSLTDNEVIEAFEVQVNLIGSMTSVYLDENEGQALYDAMDDARLLIKRQKANAEGLTNAVKFLNEQLSSAKAEAVKEFAERYERYLLSQLTTAPLDKKEWINFCLDELDNLKKEMVGENND